MSQTEQIRILIADDHPVLREGLAMILENESDMTVVGQACDGQETIELFKQLQPDITLLDLRMPGISGSKTVSTIRRNFPDARIIILTIYDGDEDIYHALQAGAKSYLLKNIPCDDILVTIRRVHAGNKYIPPAVGEKLAERMNLPQLSEREREVLCLIAEGKSNQEIGKTLGITEGTVKFHVNNILAKLNVNDRTQAAIAAFKRGISCL